MVVIIVVMMVVVVVARVVVMMLDGLLYIRRGSDRRDGDYGFQPGDNEATLSRMDQQTQVVNAVVEFLKGLSK